jgi:hypothetical protein
MNYQITNSGIRFEFQIDLKAVRHFEAAKYKTVQKEPRLRRSLILAHHLKEMFAQGKAESFSQAGEWLGVSMARLNQVLNLLLLSPNIQEEILFSNNEKIKLVTEHDVREITMTPDWCEQKNIWRELTALSK